MGTEQDQSSAQIDLQFYYRYCYYFDNVKILNTGHSYYISRTFERMVSATSNRNPLLGCFKQLGDYLSKQKIRRQADRQANLSHSKYQFWGSAFL